MTITLLIVVGLLGLVTVVGVLMTKAAGFGRFSTSVLLLTLVLFLSSLLLITGHFEGPVFVNVLFAIIGFAGGLITARDTPGK